MKIPTIETTLSKYFLQYLTIVNPAVLKNLSPMQLKVLAGFNYYNYYYRAHPIEVRQKLLASPITKKLIREFVSTEYLQENKTLSEGNFNNLIKELRKKKIVEGEDEDLIIKPVYLINPEKDNKLEINWSIK